MRRCLTRRHASNPDTLPTNAEWQVGDHVIWPRHALDLGPGFYRLYFDKNERLVAALAFQPPRRVLREELVARYPAFGSRPRRSISSATSTPARQRQVALPDRHPVARPRLYRHQFPRLANSWLV
jgi:hypothetical protein